MYQLTHFCGLAFLTYTVISNYDTGTSRVSSNSEDYVQTRKKEFNSGTTRACKCNSQGQPLSVVGSHVVRSLSCLLLPFPSGRWNPWKMQTNFDANNSPVGATSPFFLLGKPCPSNRTSVLLWQCAALKAPSVLPRGWALLGREEELQCWSSWLKKYFS